MEGERGFRLSARSLQAGRRRPPGCDLCAHHQWRWDRCGQRGWPLVEARALQRSRQWANARRGAISGAASRSPSRVLKGLLPRCVPAARRLDATLDQRSPTIHCAAPMTAWTRRAAVGPWDLPRRGGTAGSWQVSPQSAQTPLAAAPRIEVAPGAQCVPHRGEMPVENVGGGWGRCGEAARQTCLGSRSSCILLHHSQRSPSRICGAFGCSRRRAHLARHSPAEGPRDRCAVSLPRPHVRPQTPPPLSVALWRNYASELESPCRSRGGGALAGPNDGPASRAAPFPGCPVLPLQPSEVPLLLAVDPPRPPRMVASRPSSRE